MNYNAVAFTVMICGVILFYLLFMNMPAFILESLFIVGLIEGVAVLFFFWAELDKRMKQLEKRLKKLEEKAE